MAMSEKEFEEKASALNKEMISRRHEKPNPNISLITAALKSAHNAALEEAANICVKGEDQRCFWCGIFHRNKAVCIKEAIRERKLP